jgi:hypothetical protein
MPDEVVSKFDTPGAATPPASSPAGGRRLRVNRGLCSPGYVVTIAGKTYPVEDDWMVEVPAGTPDSALGPWLLPDTERKG